MTRAVIACAGSQRAAERELAAYQRLMGPAVRGTFEIHRCITGARRWYVINALPFWNWRA